MPEGMPADPAQPHLLRCGDEPVLLDFTGPVRLSCIRICKDPVFFVRRRSTPQLMLSQLFRQRRVKWHPSLRSRRFDSAWLSVNIGLAYAYSHAFPIDVTPLQAEYFANPKSHAHCNNAHRSKQKHAITITEMPDRGLSSFRKGTVQNRTDSPFGVRRDLLRRRL